MKTVCRAAKDFPLTRIVILSGALEHRDSMGSGSVIRPGDVQRMSAGTGVSHSEFNPSPDEPCHLLQIWIMPKARGLTPSYEQKSFTPDEQSGVWRLIASPDGTEGSVTIHQDARVHVTLMSGGESLEHSLDAERFYWLHLARGRGRVNEIELGPGDAAAIKSEAALTFTAAEKAELLLFDLA